MPLAFNSHLRSIRHRSFPFLREPSSPSPLSFPPLQNIQVVQVGGTHHQLYGWAQTGINIGPCHLSGHMIGRDEARALRINQSVTGILIAPVIGSGSYK